MITIWGGWPTRSFRPVWLLEELGIPYELRIVDLRRRASDPELMALNPAGFLPVMRDGEVSMVESVAIMQYLLDRYGPGSLGPPAGEAARARFLQFQHLGEAGLAAYLNIAVASRLFAPEDQRENWGASVAKGMFLNRLGLVASRLEEAPYLAGDAFTAADISVAYALELGARLGLADQYGDRITDYLGALTKREAYARALARAPPWPSG